VTKSVVAHVTRNFKKSPGDMVHQFSTIAQSSICIGAYNSVCMSVERAPTCWNTNFQSTIVSMGCGLKWPISPRFSLRVHLMIIKYNCDCSAHYASLDIIWILITYNDKEIMLPTFPLQTLLINIPAANRFFKLLLIWLQHQSNILHLSYIEIKYKVIHNITCTCF